MAEHLFIISIILFASGSLFALCFYRWQMLGNSISLILAAIASCFNIAIATSVLFNHSAIRFNFLLYHAIIKFSNCYATKNGIDNVIPVDAYIPGCPPRPQAIIHGFLLALDRLRK